MKNKVMLLILTMILSIVMSTTIFTEGALQMVRDKADILTADEENNLTGKLNDIRNRQGIDVVIVTVEDVGTSTVTEYADDYYDNYAYSPDGILLLISMSERDWCISTAGEGITIFTDAGQAYITDIIVDYLSDGEYYEAFDKFATLCDEFINQANTGWPYDAGNLPKEPFKFLKNIIIALVAGIIVAFLITGSMKKQLKTVNAQTGAKNYLKDNSLHINVSRDMYLYRNVTRTKRAESSSGGSSTHTSSSGNVHGGSSGKF